MTGSSSESRMEVLIQEEPPLFVVGDGDWTRSATPLVLFEPLRNCRCSWTSGNLVNVTQTIDPFNEPFTGQTGHPSDSVWFARIRTISVAVVTASCHPCELSSCVVITPGALMLPGGKNKPEHTWSHLDSLIWGLLTFLCLNPMSSVSLISVMEV